MAIFGAAFIEYDHLPQMSRAHDEQILLSKILIVDFQPARCRQGYIGDERHRCGRGSDMNGGDNTGRIRSSGADLRERRRGVRMTKSQGSKLTRRWLRTGGNGDLTC